MKQLPFDEIDKITKEAQQIIESEDHNREKKIQLRKMLDDITEGKWNIIEDTLINVQVGFKTEVVMWKLEKMPVLPKQLDKLREELTKAYKDTPDFLNFLLDTIPEAKRVRDWVKRRDWKEEVENRFREEDLFCSDKRAKLIQLLYSRAMSGDNKSAEMWLKMSGDLNNIKEPNKDKTTSQYEEIQSRLWKGKTTM
jgi:hypothetical protein